SQARNQATGALGHFHWFLYTEDPAGVPGKYRDGKLAHITRSQVFTKEQRGETQVRESLSAVADDGGINLSLTISRGEGGRGARQTNRTYRSMLPGIPISCAGIRRTR